MKKIGSIILNIITVVYAIILVGWFVVVKFQNLSSTTFAYALGKVILWFMGIVLLIGFVVLLIMRIGYKKRCPSCRKWFALKKIGTEEAGSKDISVLTDVKTYNKEYRQIGYQEQYIGGTRTYYHKNYKCKYCGKVCYDIYSKDRKNI